MTFYVPLACAGGAGRSSSTHASNAAIVNPPSTLPPFVRSSTTPEEHLNSVFDSILKAKRVAVVCGAGISVEAGIPDFRSPDGLFQSLKRDNPKESLTSGKDLFDASVFKSTTKTALFYQMIASLASISSRSEPTSFHKLLRTLDDNGQLLRVYTQNIDALEMKAGLSFGVPEFEERFLRSTGRVGKPTKGKGKANSKPDEQGGNDGTVAETTTADITSLKKGKTKSRGKREPESGTYSYSVRKRKKISSDHPEFSTSAQQGPLVSIPEESTSNIDLTFRPPLNIIPRCIPLHGTLLTLHCQHCTQTYPLNPPPQSLSVQSQTPPRSITSSPDPFHHTPPSQEEEATRHHSHSHSPTDPSPYMLHTLLTQGTPPPCPSCTSLEQTRALVGKRLRGVGRLRPSVVLYGEEHREGEGVGEAVRRDLCGIIKVETVQVGGGNGDSSKDQAVAAAAGQDIQTVDAIDNGLSNMESTITSPSKSKPRSRTTRSTRKGPDLLLVVGTSLRVPGTKRIVREFSRAVKSTSSSSNTGSGSGPTPESSASTSPVLGTTHLPTPTPPPPPDETSLHNLTTTTTPTKSSRSRNSSSSSSKQKIKTIYINNEFPLSAREWEGVFDVWVQGDVQVFARALAALMQEQDQGCSSEMNNDVVVVDEDVAITVEEESTNIEVPKKKVKQKRKLEDEEGNGIQETVKKKKKKRKTDSVKPETVDVGKVFPLSPPATVRRSKLKHTSKVGSNTVVRLGSSLDVNGDEGEDVFKDPSDMIVGCPGFQMSQIDDLDIDVVDVDGEELELDWMVKTGSGSSSSSSMHNTSTFVFSPAPTPPPTTNKKKRKVILKLPPCDPPSFFIPKESYSTSSDPFLESDIINPTTTISSQFMDLDVPLRRSTTTTTTNRGKSDVYDSPSHCHSTIWKCSTSGLEPSVVLPSMTTYTSDTSTTTGDHFEYYANPNPDVTRHSGRPHLNLHSSSPLSSLTSLSPSSSRRPSFAAPVESEVVVASGSGSCSSPTSHRSPPSAPYMSYDDPYGFADESQLFGWDGILDGVLPVYA